METLCADQSPDSYAAAQSSFNTLVDRWSRVEIIRFGPITGDNRLERILFWPDRKSIGLRQVQAALAAKDPTATDPATLQAKSVAMQGLGALEFVLFGTGSESLNEPGDAYRCAYGLAVARNIEAIALAVSAEWNDPEGFSKSWANPAPDNPLFRNDMESLTELFEIFVHGLEMVRDVRIDGFLGESADADKPKLALFWRSGATIVSLRSNFEGLQSLFDTARPDRLLAADSRWIADSIRFEFGTSMQFFDRAAGSILEVLKDERRDALPVIRVISSHLTDLFGAKLAGALGLSAGFSSLDGD